MKKPFLSIIIPAYNEEIRLPTSLEKIRTFLEKQSYSAEVLMIENGSSDKTYEVAKGFESKYSGFYAYHIDERGKGIAVKTGMLKAKGDYRFICDADLSMPIDEVNKFLPPLLDSYDIAIASREAPGAKRYDEPHYRHIIGRIFNFFVRIMALPGLQDSQCGFKCFTAQSAEFLFSQQKIFGWTFDVEVLFIARKNNLSIVEVPVNWYYSSDSKVKFLRDSLHMAVDLFKIRFNWIKGIYARNK